MKARLADAGKADMALTWQEGHTATELGGTPLKLPLQSSPAE